MLRHFIQRMNSPLARVTLLFLAFLLSACIKPGSDEILVTPYTKIDFPASGETSDFAISSNFLWTIEISDTWVTINPMRGYGDRNVTVTAAPNTNLAAREATFTISGEKAVREITVTQKGETPQLTLDSMQKTVQAAGDTVSVGVTTNLELQVTPDQGWISFTETRTVTTTRYVFTVEPNTLLEARQGSVLFKQKDGSLSAVLRITQDAEAPGIEVETKTVTATAEGGAYKVTVVSNIEWEATTETPWIDLTGTKLMQPKDCEFTVAPNTRVETRAGTIYIWAPEHPQLGQTIVTVTQEGAEPLAELTPQILEDIPAEGGIYTVTVETNFHWQTDLSETAGWVTCEEQPNDQLRITIEKNESVQPRSTTLEVVEKGGTYKKTLIIEQQAGERFLELPTQSKMPQASAAGGVLEIPITSNVPWKATVSETWLTVIETKSKETTILTLQVDPNEQTEPRQAALTVITEDQSEMPLLVARIIRQEGAQPHITAQTDTLQVPSAGGFYEIPVQANVPWKIFTYPSWLEDVLSVTTERHDGTLSFTVLPNKQTVPRSAKIELVSTDNRLRTALVIEQAPEQVFVNATLDAPDFLHNEGDVFTLAVETNIQAEYVLEAPWVVQKTVKTEDRTTTWTFEVLPVPTVNSRTAVIQIRKVGTEQVFATFKLTQRGARVAQRDSLALVSFYNKMHGENWRDTYLWIIQLPVDSWPGVVLETAVRNGARYVKEISLPNARLQGSIGDGLETDPLAVLSYLEKLDLSNNEKITGWLPLSWRNLNNLEKLNLESCNIGNYILFGYNIPAQYATGLRSLKSLVLKNNLLNGEIPRELLDHPYFEEWDFEKNIQPQKGSNLLTLPPGSEEP